MAWAHPKFGSLLASCSYDGRVIVWKEGAQGWSRVKEHRSHESSVNAIAWCPHEFGLRLACASSDGKVSVLSYHVDAATGGGSWSSTEWPAHQIGANAVAWSPASRPESLISAMATGGGKAEAMPLFGQIRLATGGCDNLVKIWRWAIGSMDRNGIFKRAIVVPAVD